MKFILGALILFHTQFALANAVKAFRKHVTDWDYESTDQLGERCKIELFGSSRGGIRVDLLATGVLQFELYPETDYMEQDNLFVATAPADSDSGTAKQRLIVRNKSTLTIEREFLSQSGRVYVSGLTCDLRI